MKMEMPGNACTRGFSEVHSEVQAVRPVTSSQPSLRMLRELHHLAGGPRLKGGEARRVNIRQNHEVP